MRKKSSYKRRATRLPKMITCQRDFHQIDTFMRMVENDGIYELQGVIIMTTADKEIYSVLEALEGWMECFQQIADATNTPYDDAPMKKMAAYLKYDVPMKLALVHQAKDVVNAQRKLYMMAPDDIITKISTALLEKNKQEQAA